MEKEEKQRKVIVKFTKKILVHFKSMKRFVCGFAVYRAAV